MKKEKLVFIKQEFSTEEIPISDAERVQRLDEAQAIEAAALIIKDTFEAEKAEVAETIKPIKAESKEAFENACIDSLSNKKRCEHLDEHLTHEADIKTRKECLEVEKQAAEEKYLPMEYDAARLVGEAKRGTQPLDLLCKFERIEGTDDIVITDADSGQHIITRPICNDDQILPLGLNDGETGHAPAVEPAHPRIPAPSDSSLSADDIDQELIEEATEIIRQTKRASTSSMQRRLRIGYNKAAYLMEALEAAGVIGPPNGSEPREILIDTEGAGE